MWLQGRLDLVAEPESGDRQLVWDIQKGSTSDPLLSSLFS